MAWPQSKSSSKPRFPHCCQEGKLHAKPECAILTVVRSGWHHRLFARRSVTFRSSRRNSARFPSGGRPGGSLPSPGTHGADVRRDSDKLLLTSAQVECGARGTSCLRGLSASLSTLQVRVFNLSSRGHTVRIRCSLA